MEEELNYPGDALLFALVYGLSKPDYKDVAELKKHFDYILSLGLHNNTTKSVEHE